MMSGDVSLRNPLKEAMDLVCSNLNAEKEIQFLRLFCEGITDIQTKLQKGLDEVKSEIIQLTRKEVNTAMQTTRVEVNTAMQTTRKEVNAAMQTTQKEVNTAMQATRNEVNTAMHTTRKEVNTVMQTTRQDVNTAMRRTRTGVNSAMQTIQNEVSTTMQVTRNEIHIEVQALRNELKVATDQLTEGCQILLSQPRTTGLNLALRETSTMQNIFENMKISKNSTEDNERTRTVVPVKPFLENESKSEVGKENREETGTYMSVKTMFENETESKEDTKRSEGTGTVISVQNMFENMKISKNSTEDNERTRTVVPVRPFLENESESEVGKENREETGTYVSVKTKSATERRSKENPEKFEKPGKIMSESDSRHPCEKDTNNLEREDNENPPSDNDGKDLFQSTQNECDSRHPCEGDIYENDLEIEEENSEKSHKFRKINDNTLTEEMLKLYLKLMESVGILFVPGNIGTIFRVGKQYGMTAAHLIASGPNVTQESILQLLGHVYVTFIDGEHKLKLKRRVVFINFKLDVAVLEFEENQELPPSLVLCRNDIYFGLNDVAVIGIGHPNHITSKCVEHDVKIVKKDKIPVDEIREYLQNNRKIFEAICSRNRVSYDSLNQSYAGIDDTMLLLNAFMANGASGAPVVTTNTLTKQPVVIGVFICGYPKLFYDLPEVRKYFPLDYTFEAATSTTSIYETMVEYSTAITSELFQT